MRSANAGHGKAGDRLLATGLTGTVLAALCCFTPALVGLLGLVGLSALAASLDSVLLPAMGGFLLLTLWALWRRRRQAACCPAPGAAEDDG